MWYYLNNLCENSHCSPEQVAEYLAGTCSDGDVSALLSLLPTREASCSQGNGTECSQPSPCGMTCELSTASLGADTLTLSAADSPVRILAPLERARDLVARGLGFGLSMRGSSKKSDHQKFLSKTPQCFALADLNESSKTLPPWGMMRGGEFWELPTLVRPTLENECGLSLPTPTAHEGGRKKMWPTITATGNMTAPSMQKWPSHQNFEPAEIGGALNPTWVEWLMGWPLGWTALQPLETGRFHSWLLSHGGY